ncbi:MAG: UvrD-helicase domain-containing protein [Chloroflexota bacterium]
MSPFMDILAGLNSAQTAAVEAPDGPMLIVAGPGSGKTRVITHRIAYLLSRRDVPPYRVMAVTFTNKAAREMMERLSKLVGEERTAELTLGTFHAICARILRRDGAAIGVDNHFVIYDEEDQLGTVKQSFQELDIDSKQFSPSAVQSAIKGAKSKGIDVNAYPEHIKSYFDETAYRVYQRYEQLLSQYHALDFDDLLLKTAGLFSTSLEVLGRYQDKYLHVLVDEFQDTNLTQYSVVRRISGRHRNLCVVGDPDQSIYSWRFADMRNILSFERDFPDARVVLLEQNYRSTGNILGVASGVISANAERKPKSLWTDNERGVPAVVFQAESPEEEARFVVGEIERLTREHGLRLKDCAVMYRVNAQSRPLEETLMRYGMPYKLVGGVRFYQRREVKDVLAYLKVIMNPDDSLSLARIVNVPQRGIGQQTLDRLRSYAESQGSNLYRAMRGATEGQVPSVTPRASKALGGFLSTLEDLQSKKGHMGPDSLIDEIVDATGYRDYLLGMHNAEGGRSSEGQERWENVLELRGVAQQYEGPPPDEALTGFLEKMTLVSDVDGLDEKANGVTLITLHQAKGLEFPAVFIVGVEQGLLPHRRSLEDPVQLEEERRLCYVGITRAEKYLYLLYSLRRSLYGSSAPSAPSVFLRDVPPELTTSATVRCEETAEHLPLLELSAGDRVRHRAFGAGVVTSCETTTTDCVVTVRFDSVGTKRLLLSLAHLEKAD